MKAAFGTWVNLVTQLAEVVNFPAGRESLE